MEQPFVGREAELRGVAEALEDPAATGVTIIGSAGVGKTRVARAVAELAAARGYVVAWVRATRAAASIPLGAFAPLLPASGPGRPDEDADLLARARQALADRAGDRRLL